MFRTSLSTARVAIGLGIGLAVGALVALAYPRSDDAELRTTYQQLAGAGVPVRIVGWIAASAAEARLTSDGGYSLSVHDSGLGDVNIDGRRATHPDAGGKASLSWQDGGTVYAVHAIADAADIAMRVVPHEVGIRQIQGGVWDTPVLYLWYLPLIVVVIVAVVARVLTKPDAT
jgi:hypothetical protein